MAFADPQSITINAIANTLPRTGTGISSGTFTKDDGNVKVTVSHQYGKRNRRTVRLDFQKVAADPFLTGVNNSYSYSAYLVVDGPKTGFTNAEIKQGVDGLLAYLSASSGAKVTQLLGGES